MRTISATMLAHLVRKNKEEQKKRKMGNLKKEKINEVKKIS